MYLFKTKGTCSKQITFVVNSEKKVKNISYEGGCTGNLKILSELLDGMEVDQVIKKLEGTKCKNKNTSCPDQLAKALKIYKKRTEGD